MADKIVVMHDGRVEQIGAPLELYDRPVNLFVAGFIGSPAMNMLHRPARRDDAQRFVTARRHRACRSAAARAAAARAGASSTALRPEAHARSSGDVPLPRSIVDRADRLGDPGRRQARRHRGHLRLPRAHVAPAPARRSASPSIRPPSHLFDAATGVRALGLTRRVRRRGQRDGSRSRHRCKQSRDDMEETHPMSPHQTADSFSPRAGRHRRRPARQLRHPPAPSRRRLPTYTPEEGAIAAPAALGAVRDRATRTPGSPTPRSSPRRPASRSASTRRAGRTSARRPPSPPMSAPVRTW